MSKVKVLFIISTMIIFAAVAVFPNVVNSEFQTAGQLNVLSPSANNAPVLIADGGDPVPPPRPLPWLAVAS